MSFAVVTDTSANLENKHVAEYNIHVVPFSYYVRGEERTCLDTDSFDGDEYYAMIKSGVEVTTSQVTPQRYIDCFAPLLEKGEDVVFVSMSSGISGSCNSARIAAAELKEEYPHRRVEIIDTKGASLGEGLVAIKAAQLRDQGVGLDEALAVLEDMVQHMCQVFTVDDLMHLRKGGRLSNLSAVVGTVLQIKPILIGNNNGQIVAIAKLRGRKRSIEDLAARYDRLVADHENAVIGIAQAGCRQEAEYLIELLNKNKPPKEIINVQYEPVTGSHVGPGALALFFVSHDGNVRNMDK
ncbi:MAG: DegV family protein [Oscillospiraceae bacterium]|nr:DegV family protein [Oscillospiraceae bacterium]